jgi:C-terminal processing protease CtpA/Prc
MSGMVFLLVATTGTMSRAGEQTTPAPSAVSRADALADLDALFDALDRIHPAPYFNRSRELVAADRRELAATLPETMTRNEWWRRLAPLVASLEDGHTELAPTPAFFEPLLAMLNSSTPPANQRELFERIRRFPEGVVWLDEKRHMIVTSTNLAEGLSRGDRVLTINDRDADRLVGDWIKETSGDSEAHRAAASLGNTLTDLLAAHSITPPYRLTAAAADGAVRSATIEGSTMQAKADAARGRPANFIYRVLEPGVGYMDFYSMAGDVGPFKKRLGAMFRQLENDKVRTLVIDVRDNGGGYSEFGDELLRYITRTPYRSWSRQELKRSTELRSQTEIAAPFHWFPLKYVATDPRRVYTGQLGTLAVWTEPSLRTPHPAEPFFSGPVCVLTGSATFSAAVIFADTVKTFHLATIVGEETGGHANMTMEPVSYLLPRTKLAVAIAAGRSVRANGDANDHNGVLPDIVVQMTAADIRAGRDPVLDRARACPARSSR